MRWEVKSEDKYEILGHYILFMLLERRWNSHPDDDPAGDHRNVHFLIRILLAIFIHNFHAVFLRYFVAAVFCSSDSEHRRINGTPLLLAQDHVVLAHVQPTTTRPQIFFRPQRTNERT